MKPTYLATLCVMVLFSCKTEDQPKQQTDWAPRKAMEKQWFDAAETVVDKTGDAEAREILVFLKTNVILCGFIDKEQVGCVEPPDRPHSIFMQIILESDLRRIPDLKEQIAGEDKIGIAKFEAAPDRITVYPFKISELFKGLIFLHEGFHALDYVRQPSDFENQMHEVYAHSFENRLIEKIGGTAYHEKLEALIADDQRRIDLLSGGRPGQLSFPSHSFDYDHDFDRIFGNAESPQEQGARLLGFLLHVGFVEIDRYYSAKEPTRVIPAKAAYYRHVRAAAEAQK